MIAGIKIRKNQNGIVIQMIMTAMLNRAYIISKENIDVTLTDHPGPVRISIIVSRLKKRNRHMAGRMMRARTTDDICKKYKDLFRQNTAQDNLMIFRPNENPLLLEAMMAKAMAMAPKIIPSIS
ncbi:MAG: hypothetical protein WC788_00510 [Candidatus Paceibacterota bacterium]|jgi:hypothetical protein